MKNAESVGEAPAGKRLHPVSMLYFLFRSGKELSGLLPLIPAVIWGADKLLGRSIERGSLTAFVVAGAAMLLISVAWIRWLRFRYRVGQGVLYIEQGLWVRRKMWIAQDRIQSLDTTVAVYDRLFGLVRLEVETAGGDENAVLSSIAAAEAARIQAALGLGGDAASEDAEETPAERLLPSGGARSMRFSLRRTLLLSVASGKFLLIWTVVVGGGVQLWDEWLRKTEIWDAMSGPLFAAGLPLAIGAFAAATWAFAVAVTFLLTYGFRLEAEGDTLTIERGVLEKKRRVIASRRIQAVQVTEHALLMPFRMASVRIVIAGGSDDENKTVDVFPLLRVSELPKLFETFLTDYRWPGSWKPVGKKAYNSYALFPALLASLAAAAAIVWLPTDWRWCALLLPPVVWAFGFMAFRQAAWSREEGLLALRNGAFSKKTVLIPRPRVQWHRRSQTPMQKGKQLATLKVAIAAGKSGTAFSLRHADADDVRALSDWLSRKR
ncbi:PH domain-containing protein [Paenibacillus sp.]|uniref:PH domain-containing protein n=1 Tax=Paenibacillus sp. TaxID=58172 RepID=UPI002811BD31|nr:PH domain-containing protein [Paenibacillus sp.]